MTSPLHHHSPMSTSLPHQQPALLPRNQATNMYQHPSMLLHAALPFSIPSHFQQSQPLGPPLTPYSSSGPPPLSSSPSAQLISPQSTISSLFLQEETVDMMNRRNRQKLADEHRQRLYQHQMAEPQRQLSQADPWDESNLYASGSNSSLPYGREEEGTTGSVVGSNGGPGLVDGYGERESVEQEGQAIDLTALRQLEMTITMIDMKTRLCIRDALYRLASSAESRKGGEGGEQTEHQLPNGVFVETETNPIDRNIANLLFQRPASSLPNHILPSHPSAGSCRTPPMNTPLSYQRLQLQQTPLFTGTGMQGEESWETPWIPSGMPPGMLPPSHLYMAGGGGAKDHSFLANTGSLTSNASFLTTANDSTEFGPLFPGRWSMGSPGLSQGQSLVDWGRDSSQAENSGMGLGRVGMAQSFAMLGGDEDVWVGGMGEEGYVSRSQDMWASEKGRRIGVAVKRRRNFETSMGKGGKAKKVRVSKEKGTPGGPIVY